MLTLGNSIFIERIADEKAMVFTPEAFGACPDGIGDNTEALQKAVDALEEQQSSGILLIPEGTYRFSGTVNIWRGIRLFGVGKERPVFVLGDCTPGFDTPVPKFWFFCRNVKPQEGEFLRDANECTFFTTFRNINFDLGNGNVGAVAIRYHIAQLCSIEDCDFYIHDARAAVEFVGNEIERCRFFGGQYGIIGYYTAPGWQFYVGDCLFEGQKRAAIMSSKTGLTLVRDTFRCVPWGIYVPNKELYDVPTNETERLYMEDCRAEQIETAVVSMGWVRNTINWLHSVRTICRNAPMFLECFGYQFVYFFLEPPITSELPCYQAEVHVGFSVNVEMPEHSRKFRYDYELLPAQWSEAPTPDFRQFPEQELWVNVKEFGAVGDGETDDTLAIQRAIQNADVLYFPQGFYRVSDTITLKENTAFIGLHPGKTAIMVKDETDGFENTEKAKSILAISKGGNNYVCGMCVDGGYNPGSHSVEWCGSPSSVLEDFMLTTRMVNQSGKRKVNADKPEEQIKRGKVDDTKGKGRQHTLWIHDGAGVFKNIWSNDKMAKDGLTIENTDLLGRIYQVSVEHHLTNEVVMKNISNWNLVSLQTEEAYLDDKTMAIFMEDCTDVTFANLFEYRMQSFEVNFAYANRLKNCHRIHIMGLHAFSNGPNGWENGAFIEDDLLVVDREIGDLFIQ